MLLLNVGIVSNTKLLISAEKSLPWFRKMIKGQLIGMMVHGMATLIAFYSPTVALLMTFAMWIFWAIVTFDTDEDLL